MPPEAPIRLRLYQLLAEAMASESDALVGFSANVSSLEDVAHFSLLALTDELLLDILALLGPEDLFSLGFVCQYSRQLVKDRSLSLVR